MDSSCFFWEGSSDKKRGCHIHINMKTPNEWQMIRKISMLQLFKCHC